MPIKVSPQIRDCCPIRHAVREWVESLSFFCIGPTDKDSLIETR